MVPWVFSTCIGHRYRVIYKRMHTYKIWLIRCLDVFGYMQLLSHLIKGLSICIREKQQRLMKDQVITS